MKTYIAFIRGINVGGHKKFTKADQLAMLSFLNYKTPQVYLHTGNWMFSSEKGAAQIANEISIQISKQFGWEVPIIVKTTKEIEAIFNACPFSEGKKEKSYFTLLKETPSDSNLALLQTYSNSDEELIVKPNCVYFFPTKGAGKAKMNNNFFENKLKTAATSRNYNSMLKLIEMSS